MGYLPSDKSIFVAFRGTENVLNWATDLDVRKMKWKSHPECIDCWVHAGFYSAQQEAFPDVLAEVKRLQALFPDYSVKTTGHSLGAALAFLT